MQSIDAIEDLSKFSYSKGQEEGPDISIFGTDLNQTPDQGERPKYIKERGFKTSKVNEPTGSHQEQNNRLHRL